MEHRFDMSLFGEDYLYFTETILTDEVSDAGAAAVWRLLELEPGLEVLDLACGHGRIANRLAERGARVTGLDATSLFLERAGRDAAERGVDVEYVHGDMRSLPWTERFDRVVSWFTSFGYFGDDGDRAVLSETFRALRPGGRLLIETTNRDRILGERRPHHVVERNGDFMLQLSEWDALESRMRNEWIVVREGQVRRHPFDVRMPSFTELRGWLVAAGFEDIVGCDWEGEPLTLESRRMVTIARKPNG